MCGFGLVQRSLAHGAKGTCVHELELPDVLQQAGAAKEVQRGTVHQSRGIDQVTAAQVAGDPLVQVNETGAFH